MSLTVSSIEALLVELEENYKRERDALIQARDSLLTAEGIAARFKEIRPSPAPQNTGDVAGRLSPTRSGKKTDRAAIREFLAGWSGSFTVDDLRAAAARAANKEVADISKMVWTSTLFWLCQNGLVQVVQPRQGNKPGTYRVAVSRDEILSPKRRQRQGGFSPQALVFEALKSFPMNKFGKKELVEFVLEKFPEQRSKLDPDVLGATLHRIAKSERGVRIAEQNREGNVYAKL